MTNPIAGAPALQAASLHVEAGRRPVLRNISLQIAPLQSLAIIGPSGAGKSTLLKCLNRMIDLMPSFRVRGEIYFHGESIFSPGADADRLRERIGTIFQQPAVFPKSIRKNVLFGVRHLGRVPKRDWPGLLEKALQEAALWDEVKDRLDESALRLSVGQQQRLCLARTLAVDPEVILLDEPTSALDPRSTEAIEDLLLRLKGRRTLVLVTHNLGQAKRIADWIACVAPRDGAGEIVEFGPGKDLFSAPQSEEASHFFASRERLAGQ